MADNDKQTQQIIQKWKPDDKIETKQIIKNRPNFHRYLFSRIFYCATLPALGLYAVFCQKKFG